MSVRLGQLQAQAIRINALGQRLVSAARLDEGEFDFSQPPAVGGPEAEVELTREIEPPISSARWTSWPSNSRIGNSACECSRTTS